MQNGTMSSGGANLEAGAPAAVAPSNGTCESVMCAHPHCSVVFTVFHKQVIVHCAPSHGSICVIFVNLSVCTHPTPSLSFL